PAADGIRDFHVTGVPSCALPIARVADGRGPDDEGYAKQVRAERLGKPPCEPHAERGPYRQGEQREEGDLAEQNVRDLRTGEAERSEERRAGADGMAARTPTHAID